MGKFKHLFIEEVIEFLEDLENFISPVILKEQNSSLNQIPTPQERKEVLFQMQSLKAPSPDGHPPLFYKKFWPVVGKSITLAVQNFFSFGKLLKEVNNSFIVLFTKSLIPKILNPSTINHFKPISLCNTVYKITSKLLVSKLQSVLPSMISPCQSAFIARRWIAENQLIVQEILHSFKR